jgi:DNA recombination protein Rad52
MALSEKQAKALRAKLRHQHVKTRESHGMTVAYVEGWHVISEANRIFGFENWDRQTQTPECLWSEAQRGQTVCFYSTKVRITVRAGETLTVREGIGTGLGRSLQPEVAHEMAVKAAETDATKRALATFGNPFGLALYDRDQAHVTKPREKALPPPPPSDPITYTLVLADERTLEVADLAQLTAATRRELPKLDTLEAAYAFWTANLAAFTNATRLDGGGSGDGLVSALKERLREIGREKSVPPSNRRELLIPKETRVRDRDHLAFVGRQPCLVCGRRPAHAHHLKFAQPRSMSLKVSDEYTVPLCNGHHDALHKSGDERAWWARHGIIEPLKFAARLWAASRNGERDTFDETSDETSLAEPAPATAIAVTDAGPAGPARTSESPAE